MIDQQDGASPLIKSQQDFAAGVVLVLLSAFAFWLSTELTFGTLRAVGPGLMPRSLAVILGALGLLLMFSATRNKGEKLEAWSFRGIIFVLGGFVVFGLAVRPLGLAVAGPLAVIISGFASDETRFGETILFGLGMTVFCVLLFKFALGLPIPLAPWLVGY